MSDSTQTPIDPPMPPPILSGTELYDSLMSRIEPDLMSANLPHLSTQYSNETQSERSARVARYKAAFVEYDRQFKKNCDEWNSQLHTYKRHAMEFIELQVTSTETSQLDSIESSILQN